MDVLSSTIPLPPPPATKRNCGAYYKLVRQQIGHFHIHSQPGYKTCQIDLITIPLGVWPWQN